MIDLELSNSNSQIVLDIKKNNNILLIDYKGYLNFYSYFYYLLINKDKDYNIRLSGKNLDSKNTVLFDFTSIANILSSLEFKKGTLMYEYMVSKYSFIDEIAYDKINDLFDDVKDRLSVDDDLVKYNITEDLNKLLYQGIELSYDKDKVLETLKKLLYEYINLYNGKTIILFINSSIIDFNLDMFDNIFIFDISKQLDYKRYNLVSSKVTKELDLEMIEESIMDKFPLVITIEELRKYIKLYYQYYIEVNTIYVKNENELIVYCLLSKYHNISHHIIPNNFKISDEIKSFLALL